MGLGSHGFGGFSFTRLFEAMKVRCIPATTSGGKTSLSQGCNRECPRLRGGRTRRANEKGRLAAPLGLRIPNWRQNL